MRACLVAPHIGPRRFYNAYGHGKRRFQQQTPPWYLQRQYQYIAGGTGALGLVYYVAHLEQVPISGRRRFIDVSPFLEAKLAEYTYLDMMAQFAGAMLPRWHPSVQLVERVAKRIIRASGMENLDWEFHVIQSPQTNAFVLPGGKVFVFTGILPICKNEDGLAVVLAHEISHQLARHSAEKMSYAKLAMLAQLLLVSIFGTSMQFNRTVTELGVMLPFSRKMETEADHIGLLLMAQACYDPHEAVAVWQRMADAAKGQGPEFLSTHPGHHSRIENLAKLMPEAESRRAESNCNETLGWLSDMFRGMHVARW